MASAFTCLCTLLHCCRWGVFTGVCVTATLCTVALLLTDWDKEAQVAQKRAAKDDEEGRVVAAEDVEHVPLNRNISSGM